MSGGDYAEALRFLDAAVELARGSQLDAAVMAAAWNALGILAKDTGRYEEAALGGPGDAGAG